MNFINSIYFRDHAAKGALYGVLTEDQKLMQDFRRFLVDGVQEFCEYRYRTGRQGSSGTYAATIVLDFRSVAAITSEAWS